MDIGLYAAKEVFNSPTIMYFSATRIPFVDMMVGNPIDPSYIPLEIFPMSQQMTFFERVKNTVAIYAMSYTISHVLIYYMNQDLKELMQLETTPDIWKNAMETNMVFCNGHPVFDGVRPVNPNTIFVGGMHTVPAKPLTGKLKTWVEEAEHGVIYISFGSVSD